MQNSQRDCLDPVQTLFTSSPEILNALTGFENPQKTLRAFFLHNLSRPVKTPTSRDRV